MPRKKVAKPDTRNLYLRGGTWWFATIVQGKRTRVSLHTDDVATARAERDRLVAAASDARAGRVPAPPPVTKTWDDAVDGWLSISAGKARTVGQKKTLRRYTLSIAQISDALDGEPLSQITSATVMDFIAARRGETNKRAAQTVKNDLVAWSAVMEYAKAMKWIDSNPVRDVDRKMWIGSDDESINPPEDGEVAELIRDIAEWSPDMSKLVRWLRETGMRLGEALALHGEDVHPCGHLVTLHRAVKHNRKGARTRTIALGRAATAMLAELPKTGRLFPGLSLNSSVVSTRQGQWRRQQQDREDRAAAAEGRPAMRLPRCRLHDLRHAFAIASLIDDPDCIYRLQQHLGHTVIATTEDYVRFLKGEGARRRYGRRPDLFGSLPPARPLAAVRAA